MAVEGIPVELEPLRYIVHNLRPRDHREIFALRWNDDADQFAVQVAHIAGDLWKLWLLDGEPVAVNGVIPIRPGVVIAGAFGTPKWKSVIRAMTRWSLETVIPCLKYNGYHRGEAYVLAANTDSRRWIEHLGGEVEAMLKGFGREREDYLLYAWDLTQGEVRDVFLRGKQQRSERSAHANHGRH